MKARLISVLLVLALLVTVGVLAVQADTSTEIEWTKEQPCAACGKSVMWYPLEKNTGTGAYQLQDKWTAGHSSNRHYYVAEDITDTGYYSVIKGANTIASTACVDLNGHNIVGKNIAFEVRSGATLNIQDSVGTGTVTGNNPGTNATFANSSTLQNMGTMNIYGGTFLHGENSVYDVVAYNGGAAMRVYAGATINCDKEGVVDLQANGTTALTGCNLGVVQGYSGKQLKLNGAVKIDELDLATNSAYITYVNLSNGASIGVSASGAFTKNFSENVDAVFSAQTAQEVFDAGYFTPVDTNREIELNADATDGMNLECNLGEVTAAPVDPMDTTFNNNLELSGNTAKCPLCGLIVEWTLLNEDGETLTPGTHYYLDGDRTITEQYATTGGSSTAPKDPITIHLNGHDITAAEDADTKVFKVNTFSTLNVIGDGNVSGNYTGTDNGNYGAATIYGIGNVNLYGGTYTHTGSNPTVLYARADHALSIYQANFVGTEGATGSHISLAFGTLNIKGGSIAGGVANEQTDNLGANISVGINHLTTNNPRYTLNMSGGNIDGGVYIANRAGCEGINISGSAKIANKDGGLTIAEGQVIAIGELADDADAAEVYVTAKKGEAFTSSVNDLTDAVSKFKAAEEGASVAVYNDQLIVKAPNAIKDMADAITDFTNETAPDCPICGEVTEWKAATSGTLTAGHYYVTGGEGVDTVTLPDAIKVESGTVCIHLNGMNINSDTLVADVAAGATLNVMGTGEITGAQAETAATIQNAGTLNLYGGTYKHAKSSEAPTIYSTGPVYMYEGTKITADEEVIGSNIHIDNYDSTAGTGGRLYMYGGEISNGTAVAGGNVYLGSFDVEENSETGAKSIVNVKLGRLEMYAGTITGGTATSELTDSYLCEGGGNICAVAGAVKISGENATVSNGTANLGGNIFTRAATVHVHYGVVENGHATFNGGNIYNRAGTVQPNYSAKIQNGIADNFGGNYYQFDGTFQIRAQMIGGSAKTGGNIFIANGKAVSTSTASISGGTATETNGASVYFSGTTFVWNGGTFTGGTAAKNGSFYIADEGSVVTIKGGTFKTGTEQGEPIDEAIFYVQNGTLELQSVTLESTVGNAYDPESKQGKAVYLDGSSNAPKLKLNGKTIINNPAWTDNVLVSGNGVLEVTNAFTGNVRVMFNKNIEYGGEVPQANGICAAAFTGKLTIADMDDVPLVFFERAGDTEKGEAETVTGLKTLGGAYVDAEGKQTWYENTAAAVAAYQAANAGYVKLYENGQTIDATTYVDLNGKSVIVADAAEATTFRAFNSSTEVAGTVTLGANVSNAQTETAVWNENGYFDVVLPTATEDTYTYHKLQMRVKSISLRPSVDGLYYTSEILADPTLLASVQDIGVVLGLERKGATMEQIAAVTNGEEMLDATNLDFIGLPTLEGSTINSVLVYGILKDGAENAARAGYVIHAAPYVVFTDEAETVAIATEKGQTQSMKSYMELAETKYDGLTTASQDGLANYYGKWESVMSAWKNDDETPILTKIAARWEEIKPVEQPEESTETQA